MPSSAPEPQSPQAVHWTNPLTLFGLLLVAMGILLLMTFWLFVVITPEHSQNDYVNIIGFLVLPGILISGLALCPIGILFRRWKFRRHGVSKTISSRAAMAFLMISFFVMLPLVGVSGYQAYHYSESAEFCGSCHAVMEPQFVAYQASPHARITCAECHIGAGASPFVKSKLSGLRQVWAVATNSYPRPIHPAINQLRPARETCEQCHWPEQFFGSQLKTLPRYSHKEGNDRRELAMLVKVGGANKYIGRAEGIHMHMLDKVEFVAIDDHMQDIPWVRYTQGDGTTTIYRADGEPADDPPPAGTMRRLDCMDCHNRVGHEFLSPEKAVDLALNAQRLDASMPFMKREAVDALVADYPDKEAALAGIEQAIRGFYTEKFPELLQQKPDAIDKAVDALRAIYTQNLFPYMKANWATYPNNIGHLESPGCFRCHDGLHVNDRGDAITSNCSACHSVLTRQPDPTVLVEGAFEHSLVLHGSWKGMGPHTRMRCDQCHDGALGSWGPEPESDRCGDCHSSGRWMNMTQGLFRETAESQPSGLLP